MLIIQTDMEFNAARLHYAEILASGGDCTEKEAMAISSSAYPSLEHFIKNERISNTNWSTQLRFLTHSEQYARRVKWLGYRHTESPRSSLYFAYRQLRSFQVAAQEAPEYFGKLCERRLVPASRKHAVEATRAVKLVLGEFVFTYDKLDDYRCERCWYWDDRLVNKVASVLTLADQDDVAPADMPAWIKAQGGIQACLNRFRQSET